MNQPSFIKSEETLLLHLLNPAQILTCGCTMTFYVDHLFFHWDSNIQLWTFCITVLHCILQYDESEILCINDMKLCLFLQTSAQHAHTNVM